MAELWKGKTYENTKMNRDRKKFVNPLNKQIGRRTGRDFKAGKTIRVRNDGLEDFNDYLSGSDADSICLSAKRTKKDKENMTNSLLVQSVPIPDKISMVSNITGDVTTLSQNSQHPLVKKRSRFDWLRNRNIGRRTGKDMRANRNIRIMENGLENFDDFLSDSEAESFLSNSTCQSKSSQKAAYQRSCSGLTKESQIANETAHDASQEDDDPESETRVNYTQSASSEVETTQRSTTLDSVRTSAIYGTSVSADDHMFSNTTNKSRNSMKKLDNSRPTESESFLKESSDEETNEISDEEVEKDISVNVDDHTFSNTTNKSRNNSMKRSNNNRTSETKSFHKERSDEETNEISDEEEDVSGISVNADDRTFSSTRNKSRNNSMRKSNNNKASETKSIHKENTEEETNEISDEEESAEEVTGDDHMFSEITNKSRNISMKRSNISNNRASVTKSFLKENSEEERIEISDEEELVTGTKVLPVDQMFSNTANKSRNNSINRVNDNNNRASVTKSFPKDNSEEERNENSDKEEMATDDHMFSKTTDKSRNNSMRRSNNSKNRASVTKSFHRDNTEEETNEISDDEESGDTDEGSNESEDEQVEELEIVDKSKEMKENSVEYELGEEVEDDQNLHVEEKDLQREDEEDHECAVEKIAANKTAQTGSNSCSDVNERTNVAYSDNEDDSECLDENYNDTSDMRPSQALSGIDVAGNKSGSISKLGDPGSTVSFNRTKKRLSYSALESSEDTKMARASRIEAANKELAIEDPDTTLEVQIISEEKIQNKKQTTQKQQKQTTKVNENVSHRKANLDTDNFLSLASRSSHTILLGHTVISDSEDDMGISCVDDIKSNFKSKNLNGTSKSRKGASNKTIEIISKQGGKLKQTRKSRSVQKNVTNQSSITVSSENKHGKSERNSKNGAKNKADQVNRKLADYLDITNDDDEAADEGPASDRPFENDEHFIDNHLHGMDDNEETMEESEHKLDQGKKVDKRKGASKQRHGNANTKTVKRKTSSNISIEYASLKKKEKTNKKQDLNSPEKDIQNKTRTQAKNNTNQRKSSSEDSSDMDGNRHNTKSESKGKNNARNKKDKINRRVNITKNGKYSDEEPDSDGNDEYFIDNHLPDINDNEEIMEESEHELGKGKKVDKRKGASKQRGNANTKTVKRKNSSHLSIEDVSPKKKGKTNKKQDLNSPEKDIQNKTRTRANKRKSSSEDSSDMDDNRQETSLSKTKKMSQQRSKVPTGRLSSSPKSGLSYTTSTYTPEPDSRQVTTNLESGVSFRVTRRSELLQNVTSGPLTGASPIKVVVEPSEGLTPCLSKKGQPRRRKGRRVTICPEENTHHLLSADESSLKETINKPKMFRHSMGLSDVGTPLPSLNSTPKHIFECTMTQTPMSLSKLPKSYAELPIEDRCIHPEPAPEGLRRSQRTRLRPVATFKNEEIIWEDRPGIGPVIIGVKPSMEVVYKKQEEIKRQKRRLKQTLLKVSKEKVRRQSSRRLSIHVDMPEDFEELDKTDITVVDPDSQECVGIECIAYKDSFKAVGPDGDSPTSKDPFCVTKYFDQFCMSAGKLEIKPTRTKPLSRAGDQALVFRILRGKILVTIHETTTMLETGDTFFVPFGNVYSIRNMRNDTAELFYTVHKFSDKDQTGIER